MQDIDTLLEKREKYLVNLQKKAQKKLLKVPEGALRVCKHGNRTQYYHRIGPKDKNGTYIPDKDIILAQKLAQKDYDNRVLESATRELEAIEKYKRKSPQRKVEDIYKTLHPARQSLIMPIKETDEEFIKNWESVQYQGKGFYEDIPEFYTSKGERVRSKSEVIIADTLAREGIPYRYEYPLYLDNYNCVYPHFLGLRIKDRKEILWEHLGMMDDSEYVEKAVRKINNYQMNGYYLGDNLVLTFETRKNPLNPKIIKEMIKNYF